MTQKSIIFDCDGVLVDSEIIYNAIERKHLSRLGLTYSDSEYQRRFVGLSNADFIQSLKSDYKTRQGGLFPEDFETIITNESASAFESQLKAIKGAADFISRLAKPCAVASSSKLAMLNKKLKLTRLISYFGAHIYSTELVQQGKPSPDVFLYSAKQLEKTPQQCVVIEDSANGVIAGVKAGMEVWGFTGGGHADAQMAARLTAAGAHKVFKNYASMSGEFYSLN